MSSRPRVRSQTTTRERSAIPTGHSPRHIIRWCSCNVLCSRTETSRIKLYQLQIQFQRLYVVRQEAIWPDDNALLIAERINNRDGNEAAITQRQAVIYVLYHIHRSLFLSLSLSLQLIIRFYRRYRSRYRTSSTCIRRYRDVISGFGLIELPPCDCDPAGATFLHISASDVLLAIQCRK